MNNSDPYKVLGVSPSDSDEKIKSVYKELVKKYHPDQYQGNPLSDVAAEKMADINAAYDQIMSERRNGGGYSDGNSYSGGSAGFDSNRVRTLIQTGNITAAESTSAEHLRTLQNHGHDDRLSFLKFLIEYHARIALSRQKMVFRR